ncbi:OmpA family protein [Rhodopseudomonas palustris]|uniref:OmpA family protein n=1 Tax=Rhodopseudomonas palustris TaxID=1076 RepID=A0A418UXM7_RHOPL|nr:OmpA family protein [Rhodopseudomonas palustris]RJF66279.1 OmpA family protein [Rhodopseudomonas palustris]
MRKIQFALLATTAIAAWHVVNAPALANDAPIILAQAAPAPGAEKGEERKGPPPGERKGPPPGAAPHSAPPGAGPAPRGEPPVAPRAEPPARPAAPAPRAEPPATPRAAPPPAAEKAAPPPPRPPAGERPTPPAERAAPRAEPPAGEKAAPRAEPPAPRPTPPAERAAPPADKGGPAAPQRPVPPPAAKDAPPAAAPQRPVPPAAKDAPPAAAPQRPVPPADKGAPPQRPTPPAAGQNGAPPAAGSPPPPPAAAPTPAPSSREGLRGAPTPPPAATPPAGGQLGAPPAAQTPPPAPGATAPPAGAPAQQPGGALSPRGVQQLGAQPGQPGALPPGAPVNRTPPPAVTAPIPAAPPPPQALAPIAPGAQAPGPRNLSDFRSQRREVNEGGRTVITEPGRVIVRDPSGQEFIRHNEVDRFRYGARDIRTEQVRGGGSRTIVVRPDGTEIINVTGDDGQLMRRIRRDRDGREIVIIDNSYGPRDRANFYVDLPPPVIRIPRDRYIVDYEDASPELIYDTLEAPPVDRIERRYTMDEIRYSPAVRQRMPSIDLNTITFETGSWDIPPDQAAKLQVIADGLNRAIQKNPREVFLIEGHTDAVGNDTDNLSLSDRRAEAAATLLTQQFGVPAENLTSQGYGEQYLKVQTDGPERQNRRVTVRRITPLLNGGQASVAPPPPGTTPPR